MVNFKIYDVTDISRSKSNQAMKFGQIIKYSMKNIILEKSWKNEVGRLVPDFFFFFKKMCYIR